MKKFTLSVERTAIACIDTTGLDVHRAAIALRTLGEEFKIDSLNSRDMVEDDHAPFVYWSDGDRTLSHGKVGNIVTIYEERYTTKREKQP